MKQHSQLLYAINPVAIDVMLESLRPIVKLNAASITEIKDKVKAESFIFDDDGRVLENYKIVERTCEIPIIGELCDGPTWYEWFGLCSYERIRRQVVAAQVDPRVDSIRLVIDSPGGYVSGCYETQRVLSRSGKPVIEAVCRTQTCSAAYLLASTAQKILVDNHSMVGSIGSIITMISDKDFLQKLGFKKMTFVSSVSPYKALDPETEDGAARVQRIVNEQGRVFVETVAKLRGVSVEKVLADYGQGDILTGAAAIKAGLADGFISEIEKEVSNVSETEQKPAEEKPAAETAEATDAGAESTDVEAEGGMPCETPEEESSDAKSAADIERDRLKAIDDLRLSGFESLVAEAKYGPNRMTATELKAKVFDEQRRRQAKANAELSSVAASDAEASVSSAGQGPEGAEAQAKALDIQAAREAKRNGR